MVESGKSTPNEDLQGAIDQALRSGMDAEAIARMVAERALTLNDVAGNGLATKTLPEDAGDVIYEPGELPDGLIDLPSAAKKYGINPRTAWGWWRRGLLPRMGYMKAPGGRYNVTTVAAFDEMAKKPRRKGRPPKLVA